MKQYFLAAIFLLGFFSFISGANELGKKDIEIKYLLSEIQKSGCKFIRNGKSYSSEEAKSHLQNKLDKVKDKIKNAEQFIDLIAAKSSVSGEPYLIECADSKVSTESWLKTKLSAFRVQKK